MTETTTICTCNPQWPKLICRTEEEIRTAHPVTKHSAAETELTAECAECAAIYPDHWTLNPVQNNTHQSKPSNAKELLSLIVSQRKNGEVRPQQEKMVELVEKSIQNKTHLLVQAGTGTGKSLGYLIPAINSGKRVIISTATKQLSEQIFKEDIPDLVTILPKINGPKFSYALIKGRNNYACKREIASLIRLDEQAEETQQVLFGSTETITNNPNRPTREDLNKLNQLLTWAENTTTGDRSEAPPTNDKVWNQIATDAAGCTGKACPFYEECYAEIAREKARESQIVVTNHAQIAQDLISDFPILGEWDVLITDEVHELESYLSSAWGLEINPSTIKTNCTQLIRKIPKSDAYLQGQTVAHELIDDLDTLTTLLDKTEPKIWVELPTEIGQTLVQTAKKMRTIADLFDRAASEKNINPNMTAERKGASQTFAELYRNIVFMCQDITDGTQVRWVEKGYGNRSAGLKIAPLWVGPQLMRLLKDRTLISTSATITVGGKFDSFIKTLALEEPTLDNENNQKPHREYEAIDVGTPFDYDKQAILYIPDKNFPAPVGKQRELHTTAVQKQVAELTKAAGGRTLALFTTRRAAENAATYLSQHLNTPVLCQGEAPPSQLIEEFKNTETSTLCATMGFWHGVNTPGSTCTLVILDKMPFAPMDDPLMSARRTAVDEAGRRGFDEVYVAAASVMLAQGVGRLIRTAEDKGVVAVLDNRIMEKYYGRTMIRSMPPMRIFRDSNIVVNALERLAENADKQILETEKPNSSPKLKSQPTKNISFTSTPKKRAAAPRKTTTKALAKNTRKKSS